MEVSSRSKSERDANNLAPLGGLLYKIINRIVFIKLQIFIHI